MAKSLFMDISLAINSIGLLLDIVGALLMFFNAQPVNYDVLFNDRERLKVLRSIARKKNRRIKLGALLLFIGFMLQLVSDWL